MPRFEDNYKNPCFYDSCHLLGTNWLHKLRCLPYFHVLGIDKSGSTDLFSRIVQHPQILGNDGEINKETMWWSWKRYGMHVLKLFGSYFWNYRCLRLSNKNFYIKFFCSIVLLCSVIVVAPGVNDLVNLNVNGISSCLLKIILVCSIFIALNIPLVS